MGLQKPSTPSPDDIAEALKEVASRPRKPRVSDLRTLTESGISPTVNVGDVTILNWEIADGRPKNGALRSDDHISRWETRFESVNPCPFCESRTRRFEYSAYHNISGHVSESCDCCEHEFDSDNWG